METLLKIVQTVNSYLSDYILIVMLVAAGLFFSIKTRFVQVRYFGAAMRKAFSEVKLFGKKHDSGHRRAGRNRQHRRRVRRDTHRRPRRDILDVDNRVLRHGDDIRRSRPRADHARRP